jgi:hypothetical protein
LGFAGILAVPDCSNALSGPSADFGKLISDEPEKWAKAIRACPENAKISVAIPNRPTAFS